MRGLVRQVYVALALAAGALAAVASGAGGLGAPYCSERPQRVMVFHTRRTLHGRAPQPPRQELLYWIPELDANTPHSLHPHVAGMAAARASDGAQCARLLYCGAPYYLPVLSLVARGHELPAAHAPDVALVADVSTARHNRTVQMLRLNLTGPSHIVVIVSPAAGARLGAVPALGGAPQRGPVWRDETGAPRETYFFALHDARKPRPWLLELPIEHAFESPPAEWAALSLAGHALAARRGGALAALLGALPAWTAPTGWDVDLHLYTV